MTTLFPNNEIKRYVNSLRCPICKTALEGRPTRNSYESPIERLVLRCVVNPQHYSLDMWWNTNDSQIKVITDAEVFVIAASNYRYTIKKWLNPDLAPHTLIQWTAVDGNGDVMEAPKMGSLSLDYDAFNFVPYDEEKALNRLRTLIMLK